MGLLDALNTYEGQQGLGLLAAAGPRFDGAGFFQRLQEGMGSADKWKRDQSKAALEQMQIEEYKNKIEQEKIARAQKLSDAALIRTNFSPVTPLGALEGGGGPTIANANKIGTMPKFDPRQFLSQGGSIEGLGTAMDVNKLLNPPMKTANVPQGGTLIGVNADGTTKELFSSPKPPTQSELAKLVAEMNLYPVGSPIRKIYQDQITKMTTHAPGVNVSYGAPVAGVDPNGTPIFFQPSKDGKTPSIIPGVAPPAREIPAATKSALAQNEVTLSKIDAALQAVTQYPGALGMQNVLGDSVQQRIDPNGVEVRAYVADIAGQKIHDRSGAAVTVGESARLKPYVPNVTDTPTTVKKKLELFKKEYSQMQKELMSGASISQAAKTGASKTVVKTGTYNGKKVVQYSDGSTEYAN